jgi:hypothetical protein
MTQILTESNSLLAQFASEEFLYQAGEIAHEMFFIVSSSVDELSERDKVKATMICVQSI